MHFFKLQLFSDLENYQTPGLTMLAFGQKRSCLKLVLFLEETQLFYLVKAIQYQPVS